ncbi:MAG: hypothetical protein ABR583_12460 [Gaiellaceae bacterium]
MTPQDEKNGAGERQGDEVSREGRRESAPNPTQERIDSEGPDERPADASWDEDRWGRTAGPTKDDGSSETS